MTYLVLTPACNAFTRITVPTIVVYQKCMWYLVSCDELSIYMLDFVWRYYVDIFVYTVCGERF